MFLSNIQLLPPDYEASQQEAAQWLAAAHVQSQTHVGPLTDQQREQLQDDFYQSLLRVSGWPARIAGRASFLGDFLHDDWSAMDIYRLDESPGGLGMTARMEFYRDTCRRALSRLFAADEPPPQHLLHVTCTGYVSPSPAQRLVAEQRWHADTSVTHVYHMGCHAAVPALRIGGGLLAGGGDDTRAEVVHTELCTLHFDPRRHDMEQLVVQSLFSDGAARYSLSGRRPPRRSLEVVAVHEEMLPGTAAEMTWTCHEQGMMMTLGRAVPGHLRRVAAPFVERLLARAGLAPAGRHLAASNWALHPGGPLIIDLVARRLGLRQEQLRHSSEVLRRRGNMSSATLPHIWKAILDDDTIDPRQPLVSLAFGPGLTICGAVMRLCEPS